MIDRAITNRSPFTTEYRVLRPDGTTVWMQVQGRVSYSEVGNPIRFFGTSINITEQKEIQSKLEAAKIEAERANSAKSSFLANMSHEIRTPVGAIMGFASLLKDRAVSETDTANYLSVIDRNSHHLLRIIDDVLDLAKVEAGKIGVESATFSLKEFLADFCSLVELKAKENGIIFEFTSSTVLPERIVSDSTRLRQIFSNILMNALKFTEKGRVGLEVSFEKRKFKARVSDTGCGISLVEQQKIFQAFGQADVSTTRKFGGTGLGLILTKKLAQVLGGDFRLVESRPGAGSTFEVEILIEVPDSSDFFTAEDLRKAPVAKMEFLQPPNLAGMKILLVEDSPDNQLLFQVFLRSAKVDVSLASNGKDGLEMALAQPFDAVIMDIQMPIMGGHEAVHRLRLKGYKGAVVALTAHAMVDEKKRAIASGFSHFLSKPLFAPELFVLLKQIHLSKT